MSRSARRTAETAAVALVLATGAAGGLIAASLAAPVGDQVQTVLAPPSQSPQTPSAPQWSGPAAPAPATGQWAPPQQHTSRAS